jgi:hypothetical protein
MLSQRVNLLRVGSTAMVDLVTMGLVLFLSSNSVSNLEIVCEGFQEQVGRRRRYPRH